MKEERNIILMAVCTHYINMLFDIKNLRKKFIATFL